MTTPTRIIAYTIAALLIAVTGGVIFAAHPFARSFLAPQPNQPHAIATPSPIAAPASDDASPPAATLSESQPFSGLVTSIWDNRVIIETRPPVPTEDVTPHIILITPATQITGGALADINVGTDISGSGIPTANGAITARFLTINPPTTR
jgi:hypothetical protein